MANPYETGGSADPFREDASPPGGAAVPPPRAAAGTPPSGYGSGASPYGTAAYTGVSKPPAPTSSTPSSMPFYSGQGFGTPPPPSPPAGAAAEGELPSAKATAGAPPPSPPEASSKFWKMEFYQQFFDINTRQVLLRLSNTLVPFNPPDFLMDRNWHLNGSLQAEGAVGADDGYAAETTLEEAGVVLSRKPDLYGPFWVCTTLWMTLAVVSNIMSKIAYTKNNTSSHPWKYDFSVATVAYAVIYLYCFLFGAVVWGIMQWKNLPATLTDTVCLYGYSMFIFELVAILCMVPYSAAQWIFVMLGGAWSTAYLLINMWHMWKTTLERGWFMGLVALVSIFHMGLTLFFKLYFFHYDL